VPNGALRSSAQPPTSKDEVTTEPSRGVSRSMNGLPTYAVTVMFVVATPSTKCVSALRARTLIVHWPGLSESENPDFVSVKPEFVNCEP
jgi:hypothetical protein